MIKPINLFSKKLLFIYVIVALFIIFMPLLRTTAGYEINFKDQLIDNLKLLATGNEYVNIQLLIQHHFESTEFWYGESYSNLIYASIPRSLFPDKPPLDEGLYIYSMFDNVKVSFDNIRLNPPSWPPSTLGIAYANFGILGVVLGGITLGRIQKYVKLALISSQYSPLMVFFYTFIVTKFQLTAFYIFYFILYLFLIVTISLIGKIRF